MKEKARRYVAGHGAESRAAVVEGDLVRLEGDPIRVRRLPGGHRVMVSHGGRSAVGFAERRDGEWHVELEGRAYRIRVDDDRTHRLRRLTEGSRAAAGPPELRAPMPGLVVRIAVAVGDEVGQGDGLVVMEAMKMENELKAARAGVVAGVHVTEGVAVDRDALLITFDLDVESTRE